MSFTTIDSDSLSLPCLHVSCVTKMSMSHFSMVLVMMSSVSSVFKPLKFCVTSLSLVPSLSRLVPWAGVTKHHGPSCLFVSLLLGLAHSKQH